MILNKVCFKHKHARTHKDCRFAGYRHHILHTMIDEDKSTDRTYISLMIG